MVDADPATQVRNARREALGVSLATSAYGISYGALAVAAGLVTDPLVVVSKEARSC